MDFPLYLTLLQLMFTNSLLNHVNGGLFETQKNIFIINRFLCWYSAHGTKPFYTSFILCAMYSGTYILENLVYELHLETKTLTGYCSHHASFNGVCYPPPLNIGVGRTWAL